MKKTKSMSFGVAILVALLIASCGSMNVNIGENYKEPLKEQTLEGGGGDKVLVIPLNGVISNAKRKGMMRKQPSLIQEIVSQIKKAENDPGVKAIVIKVNSPGGTVTASDILYNEFRKLKTKRDIQIVVCMMDIATSGGYYVSLPADHIIAHQTTITGSAGTVFIRPKFNGLMEKIGMNIEVNKSGKNKDMGSPFRPTTESEKKLFQSIIDEMAEMFKSKILKHRKIKDGDINEIMSAKVYTAKQALKLGMIDQVGYVGDAVEKAKELAGLEKDAKVIIYRRVEFADDNIYNNITAQSGSETLLNLGPLNKLSNIKTGFYYTWPAAME